MSVEMQPDGREARREYMRRWRAEHPEQVRAAQRRYWQRKAIETRNQDPAALDLKRGEDPRPVGYD